MKYEGHGPKGLGQTKTTQPLNYGARKGYLGKLILFFNKYVNFECLDY